MLTDSAGRLGGHPDYRAQGADLVVNLTNDAVLGAGRGPAQHLAHLAVRAVEARVAVIQAANSGISAYANPRGVLHDPTPRDTALVRAYDVSATSAASLYVAVGDWLGLTSARLTRARRACPVAGAHSPCPVGAVSLGYPRLTP